MVKKIPEFVLYGIVTLFILIVGSAILIPIIFPESETEVEKSSTENSTGSINGSSYYHPPTGWRFEIPEGWQVQDTELAQQLYQESKEIVGKSTGETIKKSSTPSGDLALIHSPGNTMNFKYQKYDKKRFPEFELVVQFLSQTLSDSYNQSVAQAGHEVKFERSKLNTGNFENLHYEILDSQTKNILLINQTYVAEINGLMAMITFTCTSEDICTPMDMAVRASLVE